MLRFRAARGECYGPLSLLLSLTLLASTSALSQPRLHGDVPHCAKTTAVVGQVSYHNLDTNDIEISTQIATTLDLDESACFQIYFETKSGDHHLKPKKPEISGNKKKKQDGSNETLEDKLWGLNGTLLYSFTFESLVLHYPTRDHYQFGIPKISTDCTCDCPGGDDHCGGAQRYRSCSSSGVCYVTYHPHQAATGCPDANSAAETCCKVSVSRDSSFGTYNAFTMEAPTAFASIAHMLHVKGQKSMHPKLLHRAQLTVPFARDQKINIDQHQLTAMISGTRPTETLSERQYFTKTLPAAARQPEAQDRLLFDPVINRKGEFSLHKLGWFRLTDNATKPDIRHGPIKLQTAHHVITDDCYAQTFQSKFDAEYYNSDSVKINKSLGIRVDQLYPWVKSTRVSLPQRTVFVTPRASEPILLTVSIRGTPSITLSHHESYLSDFEAEIMLDKYSNRYLNVTFLKARGSLVGIIHTDATRARVDGVVTSYVATSYDRTQRLLPLTASVNGSRYVCFHTPQHEVCKWVSYHSQPLAWYTVPAPWVKTHGSCVDCNQFTASNFFKYLNPRHWLDGISGTPEAVAMGVEIVFYLILVIVGIALCRRLVCPLIRYSLCDCKPQRNAKV